MMALSADGFEGFVPKRPPNTPRMWRARTTDDPRL